MKNEETRAQYIATIDNYVDKLLEGVKTKRTRGKGKLSQAAQIAELKEKRIDLTSPESILVHTNLRALLNKHTFSSLPLFYQYKLVQLLPKYDQIITPEGWIKPSPSALSNEFFAQSCQAFLERLTEGKLTVEAQQKRKSEAEKEKSKMDPWKLKNFEPVWGETLKSQRDLNGIEEKILKEDELSSAETTEITEPLTSVHLSDLKRNSRYSYRNSTLLKKARIERVNKIHEQIRKIDDSEERKVIENISSDIPLEAAAKIETTTINCLSIEPGKIEKIEKIETIENKASITSDRTEAVNTSLENLNNKEVPVFANKVTTVRIIPSDKLKPVSTTSGVPKVNTVVVPKSVLTSKVNPNVRKSVTFSTSSDAAKSKRLSRKRNAPLAVNEQGIDEERSFAICRRAVESSPNNKNFFVTTRRRILALQNPEESSKPESPSLGRTDAHKVPSSVASISKIGEQQVITISNTTSTIKWAPPSSEISIKAINDDSSSSNSSCFTEIKKCSGILERKNETQEQKHTINVTKSPAQVTIYTDNGDLSAITSAIDANCDKKAGMNYLNTKAEEKRFIDVVSNRLHKADAENKIQKVCNLKKIS